jgi:hypothetical protein
MPQIGAVQKISPRPRVSLNQQLIDHTPLAREFPANRGKFTSSIGKLQLATLL